MDPPHRVIIMPVVSCHRHSSRTAGASHPAHHLYRGARRHRYIRNRSRFESLTIICSSSGRDVSATTIHEGGTDCWSARTLSVLPQATERDDMDFITVLATSTKGVTWMLSCTSGVEAACSRLPIVDSRTLWCPILLASSLRPHLSFTPPLRFTLPSLGHGPPRARSTRKSRVDYHSTLEIYHWRVAKLRWGWEMVEGENRCPVERTLLLSTRTRTPRQYEEQTPVAPPIIDARRPPPTPISRDPTSTPEASHHLLSRPRRYRARSAK
ncbi:hypothetical protein B0H16DRAFT_1715709 [Mycena metata]|uniref:Uncharacterized protein n=1 Tax=Mycena metata TaxID=1033252 RepID=A0AAD7JR82_9AGAR|nr:hypothetical protein B0H16DRAFT_1715709 [Mycena metata]